MVPGDVIAVVNDNNERLHFPSISMYLNRGLRLVHDRERDLNFFFLRPTTEFVTIIFRTDILQELVIYVKLVFFFFYRS